MKHLMRLTDLTKENIRDVIGYLDNWADGIIVRSGDIAMTDCNHPCEMLADMYALSKRRKDFMQDKYLFVGAAGNIGFAWKESASLMGFALEQCCPEGYEMPGVHAVHRLDEAIKDKDIVCTDFLSKEALPKGNSR